MPLVRLDPSPATEASSISTWRDPILREVEDYVPDPRDDENSIDRLVEGEAEEEDPSTFSGFDSLVGGVITGYIGRYASVPMAFVGADEEQPPFRADFMVRKTR